MVNKEWEENKKKMCTKLYIKVLLYHLMAYRKWFPWTAKCKAVAWSEVFKSGFAPYSSKSLTQFTNPCWAAIIRGVAQSSAPILTTLSWPTIQIRRRKLKMI